MSWAIPSGGCSVTPGMTGQARMCNDCLLGLGFSSILEERVLGRNNGCWFNGYGGVGLILGRVG